LREQAGEMICHEDKGVSRLGHDIFSLLQERDILLGQLHRLKKGHARKSH
jgi:hypothetical protein